jgi:hypothetical protein
MPDDPQKPGLTLYDTVKHAENQIKDFPKKHGVVTVGTFDVKTSVFHGYYTPEDEADSGHEVRGPVTKPHYSHQPPVAIPVDAVYVALVFKVANYSGLFSVKANDVTVHSKPGETSVTVEVGAAIDITWYLYLGANLADSSRGRIARPVGGAGAFTIAMLPVTVVYEPPADHPKNYARYTTKKTVGSTVNISFTDESSTKKPVESPQYQGSNDFKSTLATAGKALSSIPNEYTKTVGGVLSILSLGMDTVTSTLQTGTKATTAHTAIISASQSDTFPTAEHLGPGLGDVFLYLRNVKLAWLVEKSPGLPGSAIKLTMLGYELFSHASAKVLKDDLAAIKASTNPQTNTGPVTHLDAAAINILLSLDPFAIHGPDAVLDSHRFSAYDNYEILSAANDDVHLLESTKAITDSVTKVNYSVQTNDYSQGFWTALGLGDPTFENKMVMASLQHSSMGQQSTTSSTQAELHLFANPGDHYVVKVFYDKVFGTFAFKRGSVGQTLLSGTVKDNAGKTVGNTLVEVQAGGQKFSTRTDADGRYVFRSADLPLGAATLSVNGVKKAVVLKHG